MRNAVVDMARNPRNRTVLIAMSAFSAAWASWSTLGSDSGVSVSSDAATVSGGGAVGVDCASAPGGDGGRVATTGAGDGVRAAGATRGGRSVALTEVGMKIGVGKT